MAEIQNGNCLLFRESFEPTEEFMSKFTIVPKKPVPHGDPSKKYFRVDVDMFFTGRIPVNGKQSDVKNKQIKKICIKSTESDGNLVYDSDNNKAKGRIRGNPGANQFMIQMENIVYQKFSEMELDGKISRPMMEDEDGNKVVQFRHACRSGRVDDNEFGEGVSFVVSYKGKNNDLLSVQVYDEDSKHMFSDRELTQEVIDSYIECDGTNAGKYILKPYSPNGKRAVKTLEKIPESKRYELLTIDDWQELTEQYAPRIVTIGIGSIAFKNSKNTQEYPASWKRYANSIFLDIKNTETMEERMQREDEEAKADELEEVEC